ncbi:MAG: tryptophan 7-halogenase [Parvularculaceae bacterium]|nr:tryptophan 7-halogenase [Parvularculaceae bacterium]
MTAAGLASLLGQHLDITLVESEAIGIVGVGEATLPHLRHFNRTIGLDEMDVMAATRATVKLGIEFVNWGRVGDRYIHPFGDYGVASDGVGFHHFWRRGMEHAGDIGHYSLPVAMAAAGKFAPPSDDPRSIRSSYRWAYQFDATTYAPYLRRHAEARGVRRIEGEVIRAVRDEMGDVAAIHLRSGEEIQADLFVDCSGFRGLLIEDCLHTGYEDWTHWLPCDRAVAAPCRHAGPLLPYTRATARDAGWQWRIPLQHRTGNGYVYSSAHTDDDTAHEQLTQSLEGELLADPRVLRFVTGKRRQLWNRNVVAVGLAGGFLEPLESTSIYLIQQGITYLVEMLSAGPTPDVVRNEYNRMMDLEFERIRDFLVLHYHATERDDTEFWNDMRTLRIPTSLREKMDLFRERGRVQAYDHGLFLEASWLAVYLGQRVVPQNYDQRADEPPQGALHQQFDQMKTFIAQAVGNMPTHQAWIDQNCPAIVENAA